MRRAGPLFLCLLLLGLVAPAAAFAGSTVVSEPGTVSHDPAIAVAPDGTRTIAWEVTTGFCTELRFTEVTPGGAHPDARSIPGIGFCLALPLDDAGQTATPPVRLNERSNSSVVDPQVAFTRTGRAAVAWTKLGSPRSDRFKRSIISTTLWGRHRAPLRTIARKADGVQLTPAGPRDVIAAYFIQHGDVPQALVLRDGRKATAPTPLRSGKVRSLELASAIDGSHPSGVIETFEKPNPSKVLSLSFTGTP